MFIKNQSKVYTGMVIGEHIKEQDNELNPAKEKKLTNIRTVIADEAIKLIPPRLFTLEEAIASGSTEGMPETLAQLAELVASLAA